METKNKQESIDTQINSTDEANQILTEAEELINQSNKIYKKSKTKKIVFFVIIPICILVLLIFILSIIFALLNVNNTNIISGVHIQGVDVSNLSKEDAKVKVSQSLENHISQDISLSHNDYETTINPSQFNVSFDINSAIDFAYSIGRSENIFGNNFNIIVAMSSGINITPSISYDEDLLATQFDNISKSLPDYVINPSYYIDGNTLIITNGKDGVKVSDDALKQKLLFELNNSTDTIDTIEIPVIDVKADSINIEEIYNSIHKDAVNASFTTNPYSIVAAQTGIDFAISIDDAKNLLSQNQETYEIPLVTLYPTVTNESLGMEAFPNKLSSFNTYYGSSSSNRKTNIELAVAKINGTVLMPGEDFSYNETVGQRTAANGFKSAPVYENGQVVDGIGGGICQVSSTLYNACLYSNLEIIERHPHGFKPSYVSPGLDATVSWGSVDYKFENNRDYAIKLVCYCQGGRIYIDIYGLEQSNDYTIKLEANNVGTISPKTIYQSTTSLSTGVQKVTQSGSSGCKTETYKLLYDSNGNLVSRTCISKDTYNPHNKIVSVGA